ncbi:hypothetical protein F404_gp031 [Vibrio phage pVp-1]|uniref:Uncharacterized protein n=1 Tax=Vibrio phage pVp-1 TaxID=1150989 RepID=H6WXC2_9CAUD|nr:hypothetical protein F404_gp031 [Vibrio phage pVp-1]AFB83888.1 hypothetical protein pVp-1_0031 [Vibrio phage pVp-1]
MLCRVVPPIVARRPWILDFPKPVKTTTRPQIYYKKLERRISERLAQELEEKWILESGSKNRDI